MKKNAFLVVLAFVALGGVALTAYRLTSSSGQVAVGIMAVDASSLKTSPAGSDTADATAPRVIAESTPQTPRATADMFGYSNKRFSLQSPVPAKSKSKGIPSSDRRAERHFSGSEDQGRLPSGCGGFAGITIDTGRFRLEEPSGVMKEPKEVTVGGARGTMFYGYNPTMGDTREVWFIHGGFLYEVITYKELDTWLAGIMSTWKFI